MANFPAMAIDFVTLRSDSQHHDANSIKVHALWLFELLEIKQSGLPLNLRNFRQDRRPDSYVRLVELATEHPTY